MQNSRGILKTVFLTICQEECHLYVLAFFKGRSERADILDLEVYNDGLSFEIVKSKSKILAAAGF
jgi:hypothetical protein